MNGSDPLDVDEVSKAGDHGGPRTRCHRADQDLLRVWMKGRTLEGLIYTDLYRCEGSDLPSEEFRLSVDAPLVDLTCSVDRFGDPKVNNFDG